MSLKWCASRHTFAKASLSGGAGIHGVFRRSGKANDIGKRVANHLKLQPKDAKGNENSVNKFYKEYSVDEFKGLGFLTGLAFDAQQSSLDKVALLFNWDAVPQAKRGAKLQLLGYLFESAYELFLDPEFILSQNPGFEAYLLYGANN